MKRMNDRTGRRLSRILAMLLAAVLLYGSLLPAGAETVPQTANTPEAPVILPDADEAKKALDSFFFLWTMANEQTMMETTAPAWRAAQLDPAAELFMLLRNSTPVEWQIMSLSAGENDSTMTAEVQAMMDRHDGKDPVLTSYVLLLLKEEGKWYVDPRGLENGVKVEATPEATEVPTAEPTAEPTPEVTEVPTAEPTAEPTPEVTEAPTAEPTAEPTPEVTEAPTAEPTAEPTPEVTEAPTAEPTAEPTPEVTEAPTAELTVEPTPEATEAPKAEPTAEPTAAPTATPMAAPEAEAASAVAVDPTPAVDPAATPTAKPVPLGVNDLLVQEAIAQQDAAQEAAFANAAVSGAQYKDFSFGSVQTLHGIFSSIGLYAEMPEYVTPRDAVLRLSYSASSLILNEVSSLTFYMNGVPFASIMVWPSIEQAETVRYITVPVDLLQDGYNLLEISAYVRLTDDDDNCTDDFNGANWIKINEETCLRVLYDVVEDTASLALYPFPFISIMDATGADCAVTVSDAADEAELTAAMTLMGDLGSAVSAQNDLSFARISETDRKHIIYFGLAQNTPAELLALLGEQVPATGALVRRVIAGEKEYLIVVAQEKPALLEAARYLGDATRVAQTDGDIIHISVGEAQTYIDARRTSGLVLEGQYTLKDILGHGASFTGPFHQETRIYLPLAQDYALSSESRFTFRIRYSENLDFDRSIMTVYWGNGIPLYSRKLTKEGAAGETVSFAVPADAVGAVSTSMVIAFDLEIKDLDCTPRQLNMPWAYIAEDSTFYLPHGTSVALSLGTLPVPFQRDNMFNDLLLVLPDEPTAKELLLAGRVMNMLGAGSEPYGTMEVIRARNFDAAYYDRHIVTVGTPASNSLLTALNDKLLFRFTEDGKAVASNDKLILDGSYATQVGTVQLLSSPYAEGRSILVLSAPAEAGLNALIDRISEETKRWALAREAVLVDGRGKATSYQFTVSETAVTEQKPTFTQVVMENQEPMLMMMVGLGCMLLVLLTVILVLVRIRINKREG